MLLTDAQQAATLSVVVRPKSGHRDGPTRSDHRARCEPAPCANWSALSLDQPSPPGAVPSPAAWRGGRPHPRRLRTTERASGRPTPPRGTPSNCPPTTRCVASIVSGSGQTVAMAGQPAARWVEAHAATVKPKTFAGYRHDIDHYIVPRIGRMRLQALRPAVISKLYRDLAEHGDRDGRPLSATTVSHIHRTLRKALADAVRGRLPHLPGQRRMGGVRRCGDHGADRTDVGRQRMGAQRQPGDGPEGPAPAALECPEQVRVAGRVGGAHRPVWGDDLRLQQVRRDGARPAAPRSTNGRSCTARM